MATKKQAEKILAQHNISIDNIEKERLEGYFSWIDAPEGFYLNSTGLHLATVSGWTMPDFWDSVIEDASPGITPCSSGNCDSCNSI